MVFALSKNWGCNIFFYLVAFLTKVYNLTALLVKWIYKQEKIKMKLKTIINNSF